MCFLWIEQLFLMQLKTKTFNMTVIGMRQSTKLKKHKTQESMGNCWPSEKKKSSEVINEKI